VNILHVVYSSVPGEFRGGTPKIVYDLARAQAGLGHRVSIFTTDRNSTVPVDVPVGAVVSSDGVEIHYFRANNARWFCSRGLREALLHVAPAHDVLHSHNTFLALNLYAAQAHERTGRPLFFHVQGALSPVLVNRGFAKSVRKHLYIRMIERRILNRANAIFALSEVEAAQIRRYGVTAPVVIVPNGLWPTETIDNASGAVFRSQLGIQSGQEVILYLGRIMSQKGLHLLVQAFAKLRMQFPNVTLVLAGSRDQAPEYVHCLETMAMENGIQQAVSWAGFLNEGEKNRAWSAATIFCYPSESEGMAMSVLEAMDAGIPTIVSRECNMPQAARDGALIETERSVEAIHAAMGLLLADPALRYQVGQAGRAYVKAHHAWPALAERIPQVYRGALDVQG
jgi:glycosyltransferase involved in cell wall biosynthesis